MKILKDLHTGRKKFSRVERMHFLQELEEELKVYYLSYTETVDIPNRNKRLLSGLSRCWFVSFGVHPSFSCLAGEVQDVSPKIRMMWKSGKSGERNRQTRYVWNIPTFTRTILFPRSIKRGKKNCFGTWKGSSNLPDVSLRTSGK